MEIKEVALVLADISGYTKFLEWNRTSMLHAEQIVNDLLEAVIDTAEYPLRLNKLEGDAALLFTHLDGHDPQEVARDVTRQSVHFLDAFKTKQQQLIDDGSCPCDACQNLHRLSLKAFLHQGQVIIKKVRQFEELAGPEVILIHRLLKNQLTAREYLLMTEKFYALSGGVPDLLPVTHTERYQDIGEVKVHVFYTSPDLKTGDPSLANQSAPGLMVALRRSLIAIRHRLFERKNTYHHLPF
jgi:hypothetical protein